MKVSVFLFAATLSALAAVVRAQLDRCYGEYENFQVKTKALNTYNANVRYSVVPPDPNEAGAYEQRLPEDLSLDPLTGRITGVHRFNQFLSLRRSLGQDNGERRLECSQGFNIKILVENLDTDEEELVTVDFFTFPCDAPLVSHFMFVDTERNRDIRPMIDDDIFNLGWAEGRLTIRAVVSPEEAGDACVESGKIVDKVKFVLDGKHVRTESKPPYAIGGDQTGLDGWGNFWPFDIKEGDHILVATAIGKDGKPGPPTEVHFSITK